MDDIVIFAETKEELHCLLEEIRVYFITEMKLVIKQNYQIFPSYVRGVDYLGYRVFMDYVLLRKSTCIQMKRKMVAIREKCEAGNMMNYSEWCSINSYDGWLKPCNTFRLRQKYIVPLKPYTEKYYITNIKNQKGRKAA